MISERKRLRQRAGLTLHQLSRQAKVSATRLSQWERAEIQLSPDELMRVAVALANELGGSEIPSTAGEIFLAIEKFRLARRAACQPAFGSAAEVTR